TGLLLNWYYSSLLFEQFPFITFIRVFAFYSLWYVFILSLTIFYNTWMKSAGIVVAGTIGTLFVLSGINMAVGHRLTWFPNQLSYHISIMTQTDKIPKELYGTAFILIILSMILLSLSIILFRKKVNLH